MRRAALETIGEKLTGEFRPVKLDGERFLPFRRFLEPLDSESVDKSLGNAPLTDAEKQFVRDLADVVTS